MSNNKGILIGIAVVAVLAVSGVVIMANNDSNQGDNSATSGSKMNMDNDSTPEASKPSSPATANNDNATKTSAIAIKNYEFAPELTQVKAGTTVTWTNNDDVGHNISPDTESADFTAGNLFGKNQTYSFTFTKPGTYKYHCTPHPYMKGTVVVTE